MSDEGFAKSEIIGAEVDNVTVRLRFPGQENLSVFSDLSVALRAGGANTVIASSSDPGSGSTASISTTGNNVGSLMRASSFQGVLDVTGSTDIQDDFLIEVELDISLEVEGI